MKLICLYRIANKLQMLNFSLLAKIIYYISYLIFNSSVPPSVSIGKNCKFAYGGIGVVIHERAIIGNNCIIGQGITIGGRSKITKVPKLGNDVYIGAGARILGDVIIGNNVIIGANSVVINSVPDGSVVAGIPAKVIKSNIDLGNYV